MINSHNKKQSGVAMLEFTIVLPLMMLLLLAVTEIGRALVHYNTLTKGVRDGARYLSANALLGTTGVVRIDAQLDNDVRNLVVYGNSVGTGLAKLQNLQPANISTVDVGANLVRVDATFPYSPLTGVTLPTFGIGGPIPLSFDMRASVTMRAL